MASRSPCCGGKLLSDIGTMFDTLPSICIIGHSIELHDGSPMETVLIKYTIRLSGAVSGYAAAHTPQRRYDKGQWFPIVPRMLCTMDDRLGIRWY